AAHPRRPHRSSMLSPARPTAPPRQIHLDQCLLDRALAPPIALDNGRLEHLPAQLRYPQPYLSSLDLQALVVAGASITTRVVALIALRIAQPIRLGIDQGVQRLPVLPNCAKDSVRHGRSLP